MQTHVQATLLSFFSVFSPVDLLKRNTPHSSILGSSSALFLKCLLYTSCTDSGVGQRVKMLFYHALIENILRHGIWAWFDNGLVNTGPHNNPNPISYSWGGASLAADYSSSIPIAPLTLVSYSSGWCADFYIPSLTGTWVTAVPRCPPPLLLKYYP